MYQILAFFQIICRICLYKWQIIVRLVVVLCLCTALILVFFSPAGGQVPVYGQEEFSETEVGIGGSYYLEEALDELQIDEGWALQTGMLEPEAFSKPQVLLYSSYSIKKDDMIGTLAADFGLNEDTLISTNGIKNTRLIQINQVLRVPNQDGIMYTVKHGDTLAGIAEKYEAEAESVRIANELFSDRVLPGTALFIPGARLDWMERQEINGDLFIWPVSGRITSPYGYRTWPFGGGRQFHSGIDIGAAMGTPIRAAMSGRVSSAGWDNVLGNFVVITHHSGYRTLYGHMSVIRVRTGAYVGTGERIGDVGSTGMSTGPHLHFTVFKNGVTVSPRTLLK